MLNKCLSSREYRLKQLRIEYNYCPICMKRNGSWYYDCSPQNVQAKSRHGDGRILTSFDYREYKTWKYNRKTQWK